MATKKAAETEENLEEMEAMPEYDPWKDIRRVYIPKRDRSEQNTLEVGVNDKTYFIPKDQWVDVPMPLWEVITEMQKRQRIMEQEAKKASGIREY